MASMRLAFWIFLETFGDFRRFWPNGYFGKGRKAPKESAIADSWCALALVMPEGTKLRFRFHIGHLD